MVNDAQDASDSKVAIVLPSGVNRPNEGGLRD